MSEFTIDPRAILGFSEEIKADIEKAEKWAHFSNPDVAATLRAAHSLIVCLEARVNDLETGRRTELCEDHGMECCQLGKVRAELEAVKRERDAAVVELHNRIEYDGIACEYCMYDPTDCPQEDECADFCEFWKWYGLNEGGES